MNKLLLRSGFSSMPNKNPWGGGRSTKLPERIFPFFQNIAAEVSLIDLSFCCKSLAFIISSSLLWTLTIAVHYLLAGTQAGRLQQSVSHFEAIRLQLNPIQCLLFNSPNTTEWNKAHPFAWDKHPMLDK